MMKRYLFFAINLLCAATLTGCVVTQGEIQALRADISALERDRAQQRRELAGRLERLDSRMSQPESDMRRELAQTISATDDVRVELNTLRGHVEELQYRARSGAGTSAEMGEILNDRLAQIEARLLALEQRVDPQLSNALSAAAADQGAASEPPRLAATTPAPGRDVPVPLIKPSARPLPSTRPPIQQAKPQRELADGAENRLYERAKKEYDAKNYEVSAVLFKQFLRDYAQSDLSGNAQYWLGEAFYAQRQYEAAIVAFDEVIQKYSDSAKVPASILKQGFAFAALDDSRNARFFLEQVQRKFPDSKEARRAGEKLKTLKK